MSEKKQVAEEFHLLVREAQLNELGDEAVRFQAERAQAAELRRAQVSSYRRPDNKPGHVMNASDLIGTKSREELAAELNAEMDAEDKEVDAIVAAKTEDKDERAHNQFPPPEISK